MISERRLFLEHQAQTSDFPLMVEIEKAEGVYMYRKDGSKCIDIISGIGVSSLGHRHPKVVNAVKEQADKFMHLMVYGEFVQSPQVKLAEALSKTLPDNLTTAYFLNSGSEAVEGALKLAKRYTKRTELISAVDAYHGSSHGALSVGGDETFKNAFRPLLPDVRNIRFGNFEDLELITDRTAGVILETVQGEAGVRIPTKAYLKAVRERCNETGALLILDEIQAGFGRTGKFWAFEHFDIAPDILLCAKGMGGGMPIGAFISSKEIMAVLKNNPILGHISTFGGHPVSCAASLATLETIQEQKLYEGAERKASIFKEKLGGHSKVKEIRSIGLMMAVEFESFEVLKPILDKTLELGVLSDWFLFDDKSMRIAPPLIITDEEIQEACDLILKAIDM